MSFTLVLILKTINIEISEMHCHVLKNSAKLSFLLPQY